MLANSLTQSLDGLRFLSPDQTAKITAKYGTPVYIYSEPELLSQARAALAFPAPYGLTVRYAMKANPLRAILGVFRDLAIDIDASSGAEARRAILAGFEPQRVLLTSQEIPSDFESLVAAGVRYNATSLHQLEAYGQAFPGREVSIRINSGLGSGHTKSVSVAGPSSSFGIWHEQIDEIQTALQRHKLKLVAIHSHIGCGSDPAIWTAAASKTLELVAAFPDVTTLNLGGGFRVARMPGEPHTDMQALGAGISRLLQQFRHRTGRRLHLEIEPGTFLVAGAGTLVAQVGDIVSTGPRGFTFLKLNTGMNDILRPALHGSRHPIIVMNHSTKRREYVVVGHNCESTDLLTPSPGDREVPEPLMLPEVSIGDLVAIEGVGAYCSSMRAIGYNSFSTPPEVLITASGDMRLINRSIGIGEYTASEVLA